MIQPIYLLLTKLSSDKCVFLRKIIKFSNFLLNSRLFSYIEMLVFRRKNIRNNKAQLCCELVILRPSGLGRVIKLLGRFHIVIFFVSDLRLFFITLYLLQRISLYHVQTDTWNQLCNLDSNTCAP
jgi:hypothetical protein